MNDDAAVLTLLQEALERDGFEVVAATTVTGALRRIATDRFDVLLSDLHMPNAGDGSVATREHGTPRREQGYTVAMVVEESRVLQVSIFNTLQNNLRTVDFSRVLLGVITIADEVDSQLKQATL